MLILFICRANVGRSQIAEALFNKFSKKHRAISVGTNVNEKEGEGLHEFVIEVLKVENINVKNKKRKQLTKEMFDNADKVVVMTEKENLPDYARNSKKIIFWQIEDAKGTDLEFHRKIRDEIKEKVLKVISEIE